MADPEYYKEMRRLSESAELRNQDFLGQEPKSSPYQHGRKKVQHKWGKPESPEQHRPDEWLGSPSKKKSYKAKAVTNVKPPEVHEERSHDEKNEGSVDSSDKKPSSTSDPNKPDVEMYKAMMYQSMGNSESSLNRSDEFLGQTPKQSPHHHGRKKVTKAPRWGKPLPPEERRSDEWVGCSPSTVKDKGLKVQAATNVKPVDLDTAAAAENKSPKKQEENLAAEKKETVAPSSPSKAADSSAPDAEIYKAMIRQSADTDDNLNRSQDFIGDPKLSPFQHGRRVVGKAHKWGAPVSPEQQRPDEWLGTPTKKKGYKVKGEVKKVQPVDLDGDEQVSKEKVHTTPIALQTTPIKQKAPSATSTPVSKKSTINPDSPDPELFKAMMHPSESPNRSQDFLGNPSLSPYQHGRKVIKQKHKWGAPVSPEQQRPDDWLGSPASARKKSYKVKGEVKVKQMNLDDDKVPTKPQLSMMKARQENDKDRPDPEQFKAMIRASANEDANVNRTQETLGDVSLTPPASPSSKHRNVHSPPRSPLWGHSPNLQIQAHPDAGKYKAMVRSSEHQDPPNLSRSSELLGHAPVSPPVSPYRKRQTFKAAPPPWGDLSTSSPKRAPAQVGSPTSPHRSPVIPSLSPGPDRPKTTTGVLPKSPTIPKSTKSPIRDQEKMKKSKFTAAFAAFEDKGDLPSPSKRNYKVSPAARTKARAIEHSSETSYDFSNLDSVISKLREVAVNTTPNDYEDQSHRQASEIMQILKHVESDGATGADELQLNMKNVITAEIGSDAFKEIGKCARNLEETNGRLSNGYCKGELAASVEVLRKITPTVSAPTSEIENVRSRLKTVLPILSGLDKGVVSDEISRLRKINTAIYDKEEVELAKALRSVKAENMIGTQGMDELTRALASLQLQHGKTSSFLHEGNASVSSIGSNSAESRSPVSPKQTVKRNFVVSPAARARNQTIAMYSGDPTASDSHESTGLHSMIAHLRKASTNKTRTGHASNQQAAEIIEMLRHLRHTDQPLPAGSGHKKGAETLSGLMGNLKQQGVLSNELDSEVMGVIGDAIKRLEVVLIQLDSREFSYGEMELVLKKLRRIVPNSLHVVDTLMAVVAKLRSIAGKIFDGEKEETSRIALRLDTVVERLHKEEEDELASVIRKLNPGKDDDSIRSHGTDTLLQVMTSLDLLGKTDAAKSLVTARLSTEDADYIGHAIRNLKQADLTRQESEACAAMVRNLKKVDTSDDESTSDIEIHQLCEMMNTTRKAREISRIIHGLRRLDMNEEEAHELADIILSLGTSHHNYQDDIAEAIGCLRQVKMNSEQAKGVAEIVFQLRKTKFERFDVDGNDTREMAYLRKIIPDTKAADEVGGVLQTVAEKHFPFTAAADLAGMIQDLGDGNADTEKVAGEGRPQMVVSIPDGEEGHGIEELGMRGMSEHITKSPPSPTKEPESHDEHSMECEETPVPASPVSASSPNSSNSPKSTKSKSTKSPKSTKSKSTKSPKSTKSSKKPKNKEKKTKEKKAKPSVPVPETTKEEDLHNEDVGEAERKIIFRQKHQWRHNKHHNTVISEKRWRKEEKSSNNEVVYSPLSREQYDRRKAIGDSILKSMGDQVPFDEDKDAAQRETEIIETKLKGHAHQQPVDSPP